MKFNSRKFKANSAKLSVILGVILFSFSSSQINAQIPPRQIPPGQVDERPPRDSSGSVIPPTTRKGNPVEVTIGGVRRKESPLIKEINKELKVDTKMLSRHLVSVKSENTRAFRLLSDDDCLKEKKKSEKNCSVQQRLIDGLARGYSFRARKNMMSMFADINLNGENLESKETATHTILVNLGREDFDELNLESAGIKFLAEYEPEADIVKAQQQFVDALNGITLEIENGDSTKYIYSKSVPVKLYNTYAVRTLLYNSEQYAKNGFAIGYSKDNTDVIAVFKIIDIDEDGHLTIIWKELAKKDAPYLILPNEK